VARTDAAKVVPMTAKPVKHFRPNRRPGRRWTLSSLTTLALMNRVCSLHCEILLLFGDHYMHLADLTSYVQAQERLGALYRDPGAWAQKAILNVVASSGKFSSNLTIHEYATEIWKAEPCPIP
jgi:glucan phosphorylase